MVSICFSGIDSMDFIAIHTTVIHVTLWFLALINVSDQGCDTSNPDYQRALAVCHAELDKLQEEEFYSNFFKEATVEQFDTICQKYERSVSCLKSLANTCKISEEEADEDIGAPHKIILEACTHKRDRTIHNLDCLRTQSSHVNPLYKGCYDLMELKHKTGLFPTCLVSKEFIDCEDRLMRSACGSEMADFTMALSLKQKYAMLEIRNGDCDYNPSPDYRGFVYSMTCPPNFPGQMSTCYAHFSKTRVALHTTMLAVIRGEVQELNNWCSAFYDYEDCMRPIRQLCPEGEDSVFETENEWHRLVMMASYLCYKGNKDYKHHLPCYRMMLRVTAAFDLCRKVFDKYPTKWEAYSVKCSQFSPDSQLELKKRDQLIECFTSFIRRDCGQNASDVIEPVVQMQYAFDFLPPCGYSHNYETCRTGSMSAALNSSGVILTPSYVFIFFIVFIFKERHKFLIFHL